MNWPQIINAASQSPLGFGALVLLLISAVALAFFKKASSKDQLFVFVLLTVGLCGFGYAVILCLRPPSVDIGPTADQRKTKAPRGEEDPSSTSTVRAKTDYLDGNSETSRSGKIDTPAGISTARLMFSMLSNSSTTSTFTS